ncbi:MAG TPA: Ig-like domain repeat protein [Candidatus Limnocylindrales bacterium]|jgi:hypothetical protein
MHRGGSRWSVAIGVLFVVGLVMPAAVQASTDLTLSLSASATNQFSDIPLDLTLTVSPAVAGIEVRLLDTASSLDAFGVTTSSGVLDWGFRPSTMQYIGPHFFYVVSTDNGTYASVTSNTVEVDFNRHSVTVSLTAGSPSGSSIVTTLDEMRLHARVAAADCDGGFAIQQLPSGPIEDVAASLIRNDDGTFACGADVNLGVESQGTFEFEADYSESFSNEDATSGPVDFQVGLIPTTIVVSTSTTELEAGTQTSFEAQVSSPVHDAQVIGTGTVTFFDGTTDIGSAPAENLDGRFGTAVVFATLNTVGTHEITAVWSGTSIASPSTSAPLEMSIVTDFAHAIDFGPNYATFYPVVDGFVDTVSIRGELDEPESVAVAITNSHGSVVRRLAVPMRDVGDYSVVWNGRTTAGSTVPAGVYRITTVVTDELGAHVTFTDKVTVSLKKLVWYSVTKTVAGDRFTARGGSAGKVTASPVYAGGARMTLPFIMGPEFYALGYQFSLPTATRYSGFSFSVLGSGSVVDIGLQDKRLGNWPSGSKWIIDYFSPLNEVPSRYGWTAISGNLAYNLLGHTIRGVVLDTGYGHYDVADVRLKYRYALLK